jgi:adenylate cyclase
MLDLIAQGPRPEHRWRRPLMPSQSVELGRATESCAVPWDEQVSRRHVAVRLDGQRLVVKKLPEARNPIFYRGQALDEFSVQLGEHFVVGQTTFTLSGESAKATLDMPKPVREQFFSAEILRQSRYRDAEKRIAVLGQLPEIISSASNDLDLFTRLTNVLLAGIDSATSVAIVHVSEQESAPITILHWDRRKVVDRPFQPSERLIRKAVAEQQSVLHVWGSEARSDVAFTVDQQHMWAFATPVVGAATRGWALYLAGATSPLSEDSDASGPSQTDLRGDVKFAELVGSMLSNLRQVQRLERNQASLRSFFSPIVLQALADRDPEQVLAPRECQVSVIFCDLRGFSKTSEALADQLLDLLQRVSQALGVTTRHILANGGVVGDFHGDAAMGFWGWPLAQPEAPSRACQTALEIQAEIRELAGNNESMRDFNMGIGIATGVAVAGRIGTSDQAKVTVFGPVVNLAARLESMTRLLHVPILVDESTADAVHRQQTESKLRARKLAVFRPYGMTAAIHVSQLLPPAGPESPIQASDIAHYDQALAQFMGGQWNAAYHTLQRCPAEDDGKDFLTGYIAQHNRQPPADWDGVIRMTQK